MYDIVFQRVSRDHATMMTVLSSRLLRLRAAASLWRQCGVRPVVSYLLKINDDGVTADVLPVLVKRHGTCSLLDFVSTCIGRNIYIYIYQVNKVT